MTLTTKLHLSNGCVFFRIILLIFNRLNITLYVAFLIFKVGKWFLTERNFLISDINFKRELIHGNYIGTTSNAKDIRI
jgi:hypothetical protein